MDEQIEITHESVAKAMEKLKATYAKDMIRLKFIEAHAREFERETSPEKLKENFIEFLTQITGGSDESFKNPLTNGNLAVVGYARLLEIIGQSELKPTAREAMILADECIDEYIDHFAFDADEPLSAKHFNDSIRALRTQDLE